MYITVDELKRAFEEHLKIHRGYDDAEAKIASSDFRTPTAIATSTRSIWVRWRLMARSTR